MKPTARKQTRINPVAVLVLLAVAHATVAAAGLRTAVSRVDCADFHVFLSEFAKTVGGLTIISTEMSPYLSSRAGKRSEPSQARFGSSASGDVAVGRTSPSTLLSMHDVTKPPT